jgi:putative transposase
MSRALRIEFPGALYHVMARGVARMPIFQNNVDRVMLLKEIEAKVQLGVLIVHAFCLMVNHIHLLCETPFAGLRRIMHDILGNYASGFNRAHDRVGHLWQGRYKAILVQEGPYLLGCSKYIHLNPHKAGIDPRFDYPWSSYRGYLGESAFPWLTLDRILGSFSSTEAYRNFVEGNKEDCADPFNSATAGLVYGGKEFVRTIYDIASHIIGAEDDVPTIRVLRKEILEPSLENISSALEAALAEDSECQKRRCLVWALHRLTWAKGSEIAREVGLKRAAVSKIIRTIESGISAGDEKALRIAGITRQLSFPPKNRL